tara:strand:- start:97 stop:381 length:285 start_codon:yes stop_codon:yes gene_type:complete
MPTIKSFVQQQGLNFAAKSLLKAMGESGQLYADAKLFVKDVSETELSPVEKHLKVKRDLNKLFTNVSSTLLDIIIKVAYLFLQTTLQNAVTNSK